MKIFDSRARFDEARRFTGVFHQANRPLTDADLNEEVRIRSNDVARRTADLAEGSPDGGFLISDLHLLDPVTGVDGWTGQTLPAGDERAIVPTLGLGRREPAGLPFVVQARGFIALRRALPDAIDVTAIPDRRDTPAFSVAALVVGVRFEVPANDQDSPDVAVLLTRPDGTEVRFPAGLGEVLPFAWTEIRIPLADLQSQGVTTIRGWGLDGIPPRARVWIEGLRGRVASIGRNDFVIRGGDGTIPGAGRLFGQGFRAFLPDDWTYASQPDLPDPPRLLDLLPGGPPVSGAPPEDGHFLVYADLWNDTVTGRDDDFVVEPALDGLDTSARLRQLAQVKARWVAFGQGDELPRPTGPGTLTTVFASGDARPLRYPPAPTDPCRDRCLFTESVATGQGYRGSDNLHVRVEIARVGTRPVVLMSRENAASYLPLVANAPMNAGTVKVSPEDAATITAGDLVVLEDLVTRRQPEGSRTSILRRVRAVQTATGTIELEAAGVTTGLDTDPLPVGGPLPVDFTVAGGAGVRRWDLADWLVADVRYNPADGLDFAYGGDPALARVGDYWSYVARVHDPDGLARGRVEALDQAPPQGPVHHHVPLARIREQAGERVFEDLRPRFLPLGQVRDRLLELEQQDRRGSFAIVVGDGDTTFGDINQNTAEGVTGDEAVQDAVRRLGPTGGTIYLRAGTYVFERPVLLQGIASLRLLGDGDGTLIQSVGAGGAFVVDRCGWDGGGVSVERLNLLEDSSVPAVIGNGPAEAPPPAPEDPPLSVDDLHTPGAGTTPVDQLALRLRVLPIGGGRAMSSFIATLQQLRRIQKINQGVPIEDLPEAQALLAALARLPHGLVSVSDSRGVTVEGCWLRSTEPLPLAAGVFVTGRCESLIVRQCRIAAATGVAALPLASFLAIPFLLRMPIAALAISGLRVEGNQMIGAGNATYGVHIADGTLDGVSIVDNEVSGFDIGVLLQDQAELKGGEASDRTLVEGNRILDSRLVAVQAGGDGIDLVSNEIRNARTDNLLESSGLFHAGIQVTGQGVRVRDSWIVLPATPNAPVLGVVAGIVVGEALDDGDNQARGVFDVEITGNRIEGAGAETMAAGILIGGPQAIFDIRVCGNVIRKLGDAGVRVLGGTVASGQIHVEDNRIEEVALAEVPAQDLDIGSQLQRLGAEIPADIQTLSRPHPLLQALLASSGVRVRPALDAVLRWLERLTLRGAVVLSRLEGGDVSDNRIAGVGRYETLIEARILDAQVHTAAVALVGGRDVVVATNDLQRVRAPVVETAVSTPTAPGTLPPVFDALRSLSVSAPSAGGVTRATTTLPEGLDLHAATAALHRLLLTYVRQVAQRVILGRRIYGALDALARAFDGHPTVTPDLVANMQGMAALMRATQTNPRHTEVATSLRAIVANMARLTATDDAATAAWQAVEDLEGAIAGTNPAAQIKQVGADLATDARRLPLLDGFAETRQTQFTTLIATLGNAGVDPLPVVDLLVTIGLVRDEQARSGDQVGAAPVGPRKEILLALTADLKSNVGSLSTTQDRTDLLNKLRGKSDALRQTLRETGSNLDEHLAADFRVVDRINVAPADADLVRLKDTLDRIATFSTGGTTPTPSEDDISAKVRIAQTRGDVALRLLMIDMLHEQVGRLEGLATVSDPLVRAGLSVLSSGAFQLQAQIEDDAGLRPLGLGVIAEIRTALTGPNESRLAHLSSVRDRLQQLADPSKELAANPAPADTPVSDGNTQTPRRLAGLGALVLFSRSLGPGKGEPRPTTLATFEQHLVRALDETGTVAGARAAMLTTFADAKKILGGDFVAGAESAERQAALALVGLAGILDDAASNLGSDTSDGATLAVSTLLHALRTALDPGTEALATTQSYLTGRKSEISAAVVDGLLAQPDLERLLGALSRALERLAAGEAAVAITIVDPVFSTSPDPADGIFAAGVDGRLVLTGNRIESVLRGVTVGGAADHVLADPPASDPAALLVEVSGNRVHGAALGAFDVAPGVACTVILNGNQALACADLGASDAAAATDAPTALGLSIARLSGRGELVVQGNLFQGNGNPYPRSLVHEVLIDWRGDVVVRGNTIRHQGGGAGGVGLLLVLEDLGAPADEATLVKSLAQSAPLTVEPPPTPGTRPIVIRAPSRALLDSVVMSPPIIARPSNYLTQAKLSPAVRLVDFITARPIIRVSLPPILIQQRYSAQVEGNQIVASGPALLALGAGVAVISMSVTSNELRSTGRAGACYIRRTDAMVFASNHCECLGTVNVVVLRPEAAPVTATGNVILGQQPVTQTDPVVIQQRTELRAFVKLQIAKELSLTPVANTPPIILAPPPSLAAPRLAINRTAATTGINRIIFGTGDRPPVSSSILDAVTAVPGLVDEIVKTATPGAVQSPVLRPGPTPPNPGQFSLVILGGTRVVAAGNATSSGALTVDADQQSDLNV